MFQRFAALLLLATALMGSAQAQQQPQTDLQRTKLSVGLYTIDAQVAQTPRQREIGLMFRKEMPQAEGMVFVFDQPATQCFWMKNTYVPLSTAFLADDGSIVNIDRMKPQTLESHCSAKPVRFVLEMNDGWFEKRGIKPGAKLRGAPFGN